MPIQINSEITGYKVVTEDSPVIAQEATVETVSPSQPDDIIKMNETVARPDVIHGATYKIKTPDSEHAIYLTLNDITLNPGTEHELRRPFEIFINSKNLDHYQWVVALTRMMSAVFRKGGDVTFLVEELKAVFDPQGGYFKKGGRFMPSLVAEMGYVIEDHLEMIGLIKPKELDEAQKKMIAEKRNQYEAQQSNVETQSDKGTYPPNATNCSACHEKSVVVLDGCSCCLSCGFSRCS
jgi:hypothetical protein